MEIHKKLLATISPELHKHANNEMIGCLEGGIHLPHEAEETLTLFTEWAYTGEYGHRDEGETPPTEVRSKRKFIQDLWASIHKHLQLCVFSDKFNIPILKQLAESKFRTEITFVRPTCNKYVSGLVTAISFAYDNFSSSDPILSFLARYASWKLPLLRRTDRFNQLLLARPEFLKELLMNLSGSITMPTAT